MLSPQATNDRASAIHSRYYVTKLTLSAPSHCGEQSCGVHPAQMGTSKNSIKPMMARRKVAKKRSVHVVHEHFERLCNAASAASVNF